MPPPDSTPVIESDTVVHLVNANCRITSDMPPYLRCVTRGKAGTVALFIVGTLFIYVSIGLFAWSLPSGRLQLVLLSSGALLFLVGVLFQWRGMVRHREMGTYLFDQDRRSIRRGPAWKGWTFEGVERVRLARDVLDFSRTDLWPRFPYWLKLHFKDGRRIRIAKGGRGELQPVLDWLEDAGIPV